MTKQLPSVTIIIPCRNESLHIAECLDGVVAFDYPKNLVEVIVVDGASSDSTREIVEQYAKKYGNISLFLNSKEIVPVGLNIGIKAAKGEYIVRLDAHSIYPSGYITDCLNLLLKTGAANAGGMLIPIPNGSGAWSRSVAHVTSNRFGVGAGAFRVGVRPGFVDTVPYGTFRRDIFEKVGYFDERLTRNQDNEFNSRLLARGYRIAFDPNIRIYYKNKATLSGLLHQGFFTGMWNVYALVLCPHTFKVRRFVPAVFFIYLLFLMVVLWARFSYWQFFLLPLLIYLSINTVASLQKSYNMGVVFRNFCTFFGYHLSYGSGSWFGVVCLATGKWRGHIGVPLIKSNSTRKWD